MTAAQLHGADGRAFYYDSHSRLCVSEQPPLLGPLQLLFPHRCRCSQSVASCSTGAGGRGCGALCGSLAEAAASLGAVGLVLNAGLPSLPGRDESPLICPSGIESASAIQPVGPHQAHDVNPVGSHQARRVNSMPQRGGGRKEDRQPEGDSLL